MVNTNKLRARMMEKGLNYEKMAERLNMSSCTFGKKIRGISAMTIIEVEEMMQILAIPKTEIVDYFFYGE